MITRQTLTFILRRLGLALLLLFIVNSLLGLLPLRLINPAWQLRMVEMLLNTAPFTLLGAAFLLLADRQKNGLPQPILSTKQVRNLAGPAAIGFLLLIPLQIYATYTQIRTADLEAQQTIRIVARRVAAMKAAQSDADLRQLSMGLPANWQPIKNAPLSDNRTRLLNQIEPQLARLRTEVDNRKRQAIQKGLLEGLKQSLLALIFAWSFQGIHEARPRLAGNQDQDIDSLTEELADNT